MGSMTTADYFSIGSGALGLAGSLILAFSLDKPLAALTSHIRALDNTVKDALGPGDVFVATGFDRHHVSALNGAKWRVRIGALLVAAGFGMQSFAAAYW